MTEVSLQVLFAVLSLIIASIAARRPKTFRAGIVAGTLTGLVLLIAASALVGFLGNAMPFGQIDFWLMGMF
ncbi:hypothetical protein [Endobacterium cereale]|nr:hypothetical protein [Endobacterium cereale]MEB2843604.1 hypothetical protein [Endobacterium cereale]